MDEAVFRKMEQQKINEEDKPKKPGISIPGTGL